MKIAILKNYHLEPHFKFFIFFMVLVCFSYWDFALNYNDSLFKIFSLEKYKNSSAMFAWDSAEHKWSIC